VFACRNKLVQITYALANVYDDSPDLEVRVTDEHRARAEEMMTCVESGDVTRLREAFLEVRTAAAAAAVCAWVAASDLLVITCQQQQLQGRGRQQLRRC
jgi:hypothetical protein